MQGTDMMLAGDDSTFKDSFAALLDLFKEFGEGTGTMFVIATPCSEPPNRLIPADINGRPDLVRDHDNKCAATSASLLASSTSSCCRETGRQWFSLHLMVFPIRLSGSFISLKKLVVMIPL